ncbi:MAG: hypothetical protein HQK65_18750, partial [Desulfamplus sp.]|nr:hypothetical protein [Desulfamplus sp.]
ILRCFFLSCASIFIIEGASNILGILYFKDQTLLRLSIYFAVLFPGVLFFTLARKKYNREYALLNNINTGILIIDSTGKIIFFNTFFASIFKKISTWLPIKDLNELTTYNYFDFYLNPQEQKKVFQSRNNFPVVSILDIGSEIISAHALPIYQENLSDDRIMITWELITRERNQKRWEKVVEEQIENTSGELTTASGELMSSSFKVQEIAQGTSRQAQDVASFSREVTKLILKLSQAVNQSSSKFQVIADNVADSRKISETALAESGSTRKLITDLSLMASSISKSTQTIKEIMAQTHVLALNANIEAVKAGSAGRGFAVIAKEVGNLAKQTATMSEEITNVVDQILEKIPLSVSSIETVEEVVIKMNSITLSINDLMVEQTKMMGTMSNHMSEANENSEQITKRMDEVVSYSYSTLEQIEKNQNTGKNIESIAELFNLIVSRFGEERIVTPNDIYHMLIIIQQLIDAWIKISFSPNIWEQTEKISLERFEDKKPANVLKVSIANYQMMLFLSNMPMEEILFPKGTVTPTQTYNFLSHLLDLVEKILIQKIGSSINVNTKVDGSHTTSCARNITTDGFDIHKLKIARPVTGKTPSDAYAITHRINQKLEF